VPLFAGRILQREEAVEGWLELGADGRPVSWGEGPPPERADATGWIVPAPVNAHTHVADTFLRDRPGKPRSVAELVGPGGWKQQHLRAATAQDAVPGVLRYTQEMAAVGTAAFLDFREGGVAGAQRLVDLAPDLPVRPIVLGRPQRHDIEADEAEDLLRVADGVGLSGWSDFPRAADVAAWADAAHDAGKTFAIHASEARREPISDILATEPDLLVHMVQATAKDLEAVTDDGVPIVACPRSNAWFGMKTPIQRMLDAGATVAVGTDNGMLQDGNLLAELALLRAWAPKIPMEDLLRMATWNGRALARLPPAWPPRKGAALDLVVLPEDPLPRAPDLRPGFTGGVEST
jgi:cytosine/adenosine deaminase-related metal-dependent hydrolase